jgi:HK97 family phage prohead protease
MRDYLARGERKMPDASEASPELKKEQATLATKLAGADPRMQFGFWLRKGVAVIDESGTPAWASKQAQALRDLQQRERIEHKAVPLASFAQSSAGADSGLVKLAGFASTYDTDLGGDRVARGAFADTLKTLEERRTRSGSPSLLPLFAGYNTDKPIGGVVAAKELPGGLYIEAAIDVDTPDGFAVVSGASKQYNRGMSIGYIAKRSHYEGGGGVRVLDAVDLFEISITPVPMNTEATIDSLS